MKKVLTILLAAGLAMVLNAQNILVQGVITSASDNLPLIDAAVVDVSNSSNGVVTNDLGEYSLTISKEGAVVVSCLGYKSQTVTINGRAVVDVALEEDSSALDEVVVVAYGEYSRSEITGAVTQVDSKELSESTAPSIAETLQGRVAGMEISTNSGEPGSESTIRIRGSRSIEAGNNPIIVVDGVADAVQSLDEINPSDITSLSVLRDASSTAMYGSRGANGVIIVTTDKASSHKLAVTLKAEAGVSNILGRVDNMNATEYALYRNDMVYWWLGLQGQAVQEGSRYSFANPYSLGEGTDWLKAISQQGVHQQYSLNLKGTTKGTSYSAGLGYQDEIGTILNSGYKKFTGRFNVESALTKWLSLGLHLNYVWRKTDLNSAAISGTNTSAAIFLAPVLTIEDTWNKYGDDSKTGGSVFNNPYMVAKNTTNFKDQIRIQTVPYVKIKFIKELTLESKFVFEVLDDKQFYYSPSFLPVASLRQTGGTARRAQYMNRFYQSETTLTYAKTFARKHKFDAMAGFSAETRETWYDYASGTGYINDAVSYHNMNTLVDSRNFNVYSYDNHLTRLAAFARVNYVYNKRYNFTFTMRADGSSAFAEGNKWGFFPAGAFKWNISEEKWMKRHHKVNNLALRLSAGRSGNDAISAYQSLALMTTSTLGWLFGPTQLLSAYPSRLPNSKLTWETTDAYNVGVDLGLWANRLTVELDAYHTRTTGLLLSVKNSLTTGYDTYFQNFGLTTNTGVELAIGGYPVRTNKVRWHLRATVAHNRQMTVDVGNNGELVPTYTNPRNATQPLYGYRNGYPTNALWGFKYEGVWHSQAEIERNKKTMTYVSNVSTDQVGYARFADLNHDGALDSKDYVYLGSSDPDLYGGFGTTLVLWNSLRINAFFTYSVGGVIYNLSELWMGTGSSSSNKYRYMLDAWHPTRNPESNIPRAYTDDGTHASDRFVYDASFLRFQNLSVSYSLDLTKWNKVVKKIDFALSGNNLYLWKSYAGFDPDVSSSSTARRVDNGAYPRARSFVFSVQLTY